jgi:uridine kinase
MAERRRLIGIAGPSGSGKTLLARAVAARTGATVLALDHYYRDLSHLPLAERERVNFDEPAALDWALAVEQVAALRRGLAIERPEYDFTTHTRRAVTARVEPGPAVVVDGIFALHSEAMRALFDLRVFVELEDAVCLERRLERDLRERDRTRESVLQQYAETVRPMAERWVLPTRAHADVVVRGDADLEESARAVLARLEPGS